VDPIPDANAIAVVERDELAVARVEYRAERVAAARDRGIPGLALRLGERAGHHAERAAHMSGMGRALH